MQDSFLCTAAAMFYWFLSDSWQTDNALLLALQTPTVRALVALVVALLMVLAIAPRTIRWLTADPLKLDSSRLAELSRAKRTTPSMGGLFVLSALALAIALLADLRAPPVQQSLALLGGLALLGICDDVVKRRSRHGGLSVRSKLLGQIAVATAVAIMLYRHATTMPDGTWRELPGIGPVQLGAWLLPWAVLMIVGMSNAVNLTDGLDGLAGGCVLIAGVALALAIESGELLVICGGLIGSVVGFLRFNLHPARVFMGDTGSLPLGGLLGLLTVVTRVEFCMLVVCGVLLAEAASVVLQIGSYKLRRKRIFLCAPLHHHFQFAGWPETTIVSRFWSVAILCAALGLSMQYWHGPRTHSAPSGSEICRPLPRSPQVIR